MELCREIMSMIAKPLSDTDIDNLAAWCASIQIRAATPLMNLSELTGGIAGLQVRDRQNFTQDLQVSVRGFGTRSTFGVRILVDALTMALEMRAESKAYVDDINSDAASGYAVLNLRAGYAFRAGSVIVNDSNGRFFEPAPGRRLFVGLRTMF